MCRVFDGAIAQLAARQRGLVEHGQLRSIGASRPAVGRWVRAGRLHRVFAGVYLVGHPVPPPLAMELAAVLACAPHAFLSHFSAAWLYRLLKFQPPIIDITVAGRNPGQLKGIAIHRVRTLDRRDVTRQAGIPTTTPTRTLLDLAEVAQPRQLEIAWDEAHTRKLTSTRKITALIERSPGRRGVKPLNTLLARDDGSTLSLSDAEEVLLDLIRRAQLPSPEMNVLLLGRYKVDFLWREHRLILELDGGHHLRPRQRDSDNRRDSDLSASGWRVERVSAWELANYPEAVVARLARALG